MEHQRHRRAGGDPTGPDGREDREELPPPDVPDAQPGRASEDQGLDRLRAPQREPQHDHAAERVPDDRRRQHPLSLRHRCDAVGERLES